MIDTKQHGGSNGWTDRIPTIGLHDVVGEEEGQRDEDHPDAELQQPATISGERLMLENLCAQAENSSLSHIHSS